MARYAPSISPDETLDLARLRDLVRAAEDALAGMRAQRDAEIRRLRALGAEPRDLHGPGGISVGHVHRICTRPA